MIIITTFSIKKSISKIKSNNNGTRKHHLFSPLQLETVYGFPPGTGAKRQIYICLQLRWDSWCTWAGEYTLVCLWRPCQLSLCSLAARCIPVWWDAQIILSIHDKSYYKFLKNVLFFVERYTKVTSRFKFSLLYSVCTSTFIPIAALGNHYLSFLLFSIIYPNYISECPCEALLYLLANSRNKKTSAMRQSCDWALLLPLIKHLESVLCQRLARFWHHINDVKNKNAPSASDVFSKTETRK